MCVWACVVCVFFLGGGACIRHLQQAWCVWLGVGGCCVVRQRWRVRLPRCAAPPTLHLPTPCQVVSARTLMCEDLSAWTVLGAPGSDEVLWKNLGMRSWERSGEGGAWVCG